MAVSTTKKVVVLGVLLTASVIAAAGSFAYLATRSYEVDWVVAPNKVELMEANRKLVLFDQAQTNRQKGFIRLSEVEINSLIENRFKIVSGTNKDSTIELTRTAVLLTGTNITFVAWLQKPIYGYRVPLVWQRGVVPVKSTNGWSFSVQHMMLGNLEIPKKFWPDVQEFIGPIDSAFDEKKDWLAQIPEVSLTRNEASHNPEVRLYTYLPEQNHK